MPLLLLTDGRQEVRRRELAESFAMRKVNSVDKLSGDSHLPSFCVSQAERWRAKAVAKVKHAHLHKICTASADTFCFTRSEFFPKVMESQGQLPPQTADSAGPMGSIADEEFGPLLQVMCSLRCTYVFMHNVFCEERNSGMIIFFAASSASAARVSRAWLQQGCCCCCGGSSNILRCCCCTRSTNC